MRHAFRFLLVLCLSVPAFAAPTVAGLVEKYSTLNLGEAKTATAFAVNVGHMKFVLDSGTVTPVLAGDQQVGLFLNGSGSFTYESANKDELSTLKYNSKHADVPLQGSSISEGFKSVLLRGNGLPAPAGDASTAPAAQFTEVRQLVERSKFGFDRAEYIFVLQALNNPAACLVRADINGTERPYLYLYDDVWTRNESLTMLRRPRERGNKDSDWLYPTRLSRQAIGRDNRVAAPVNARLTDLDVTLVNTDGPNATLTITETIVPYRPLSAISFELYDEYWYDMRKDPRRYNVRSVTDEQGNKLVYDHEMGTLVVGLAQPAPAGKPLKLKFEIDGDILHRPDNSNYWELGIEPWFPMLGYYNESLFTYHAVLKVKKPFAVFSSGKTIRRETEGDWNVLEAKLDRPVGAIAILAGKYQYEEETKDGLTVRVASFMGKNASAWKALRSIAFSAARIYPRFLGPFPFDEITIIERNSLGWGQAPAGIVFITKEAFSPTQEDANDYVQGINLRIAHELAHMYWGHTVKAASDEEVWIHEAFSDYSAALFMKDAGRPNDYTKSFNEWKTGAKDFSQIASIPMANRLFAPSDDGDSIARYNLIYNKGAYLLAALHREMGDEQFLTFLKSYQRSFKGKFGTTADIMGLLQFLTKKDYAPFFEQYYYGTAIPEVAKK